MSVDKTSDSTYDICWARGDNDPKTFTISDANGPVNVSTWTFSFALNTDLNPTDTSNQIFITTPTFLTDGTDGKIVVTPPANSLDAVTAPGQAYYDLNRLTPSKKLLIKGKAVFIMDIDKA